MTGELTYNPKLRQKISSFETRFWPNEESIAVIDVCVAEIDRLTLLLSKATQKLGGPQRVQRQRRRGWKAPEGAVYVGRGSRWGNPYSFTRLGGGRYGIFFTDGITKTQTDITFSEDTARQAVVTAYTRTIASDPDLIREAQQHLKGKDLMCWCPAGKPCHADALLAFANSHQA